MSYERLTEKDKDGNVHCVFNKHLDEEYDILLARLAELENKIEDGTLCVCEKLQAEKIVPDSDILTNQTIEELVKLKIADEIKKALIPKIEFVSIKDNISSVERIIGTIRIAVEGDE